MQIWELKSHSSSLAKAKKQRFDFDAVSRYLAAECNRWQKHTTIFKFYFTSFSPAPLTWSKRAVWENKRPFYAFNFFSPPAEFNGC